MAMISCTPSDLAVAAKQFNGLPPAWKRSIDTYLLAVRAGGSTDPAVLAKLAKAFMGLPDKMLQCIQAYLLCQIASGGGGTSFQDMQVAWTPTNQKLGEDIGFFHSDIYGYTLSGITSLTFNQSQTNAGFWIADASDLVTIAFPNITTILGVASSAIGGSYTSLLIKDCAKLTTILAPLLTHIDAGLAILNNTLLTSISLPSLVDIDPFNQGGGDAISGNTALISLSLPAWVPTNGITYSFFGNALNAASVNGLLARGVANVGFVSGAMTLAGGTNAAPSGQGIADKATLIGRGVTVNTN